MSTEHRCHVDNEIRVESGDGGSKLIGHAAIFFDPSDDGTQFSLSDHIVERIAPSAFNRAIAESHDVVGLFDHSGLPLGRTSAGTMRISTDEIGLRYEIDLPDTESARSIRTLVSRGDLRGSSFGFRATGEDWTFEGNHEVRTITDVDLKDVGPVSLPAYTATDVQARNDQHGTESRKMAAYAIEHRTQEDTDKIEELRRKADEVKQQRVELESKETEATDDISDADRNRRLRVIEAGIRCTQES